MSLVLGGSSPRNVSSKAPIVTVPADQSNKMCQKVYPFLSVETRTTAACYWAHSLLQTH